MLNLIPRTRGFPRQFRVSSLIVVVALAAVGSWCLSPRSKTPMTRDATWPAGCPHCGSPQVARILYGYLLPDDRMERALDEGVIALGGCIGGGPGDPKWQCQGCGHEWGGVLVQPQTP